MYLDDTGPFLAMRGPFIAAAGGSEPMPPVSNAVIASISGTTITVTGTTAIDISAGVWGVEYSILDNGGNLSGYTFSKNVVGQVSSQSITLVAGDGVTTDSTVTIRAYYNLDPLDSPATRVYSNGLVPYVVAGATPSGTAQEGQTLTQVQGVIAGSSPMVITYQWRLCDAGGSTCSNIGGQTAATHVIGASEVGGTDRVNHTGTNGAGTDNEDSGATAVITSSSVPAVFGQSSTGQDTGGAGTLTFSATVASGSNRLLLVHVAWTNGVTGTLATGVTFNGDAMTYVTGTRLEQATQVLPSFTGGEVWSLVAPDVATGNVIITMNGTPSDLLGAAASWTGVNQSVPVGTPVTAGSNANSTPSVTVLATDANDVVLGASAARSDTAAGTSTPDTERWERVEEAIIGMATLGASSAGGGDVTINWVTNPSLRGWVAAAFAIKPS